MEDRKIDEEMLRQMVGWLNRGINSDNNPSELNVPHELSFTEEDIEFLRRFRISSL